MRSWAVLDLNKVVRPEVLEWCRNNKIYRVYDNNAYTIKHIYERDIGTYVAATEVAMAYYLLEHRVVQSGFSVYKIYRQKRNNYES